MVVSNDYDTLDDLPSVALEPSFLNHIFFTQLQSCTGILIRGASSKGGPCREGYWGRSLILAAGETLQMRVQPKGGIGSGAFPC
jgi:hypothetical protein